MINNILTEFLPWNKWVALPGNRNLPLAEQMRKYEVERNNHLRQLLYYEAQPQVNQVFPKTPTYPR